MSLFLKNTEDGRENETIGLLVTDLKGLIFELREIIEQKPDKPDQGASIREYSPSVQPAGFQSAESQIDHQIITETQPEDFQIPGEIENVSHR